jgi:hypothetical protein
MFTQSFPPANALLEQITNVNYKKHLHQFLMLSAALLGVTVGVLQFFYNKAAQWYHNGGKDLLLDYAHRAALFINNKTQVIDKLYAVMVSVHNRIELVAHKISDVTDVEVAQ